nr:MAG TPA: Receptor recognition protein, Long tail, Helical sandwich, Tail fiber [Caudoviricetes sp.]
MNNVRVMMDERFMMNKKALKNVLTDLVKVEPVSFTSMDATCSRGLYGITGQSLVKKFPYAVTVDGLGNHYVEADMVIPLLLQACRELNDKVGLLEARVATLEKQG